jgi:hypothetical protein
MDLLASWLCWMTLPFSLLHHLSETVKARLLCTGLFDFIDVFGGWFRVMLFAVGGVIDSGSITMLLTVQVMMLMR